MIKAFNSVLAYSLENFGKNKNKKIEKPYKLWRWWRTKKIVMKLIEGCGFYPYNNGIWKIHGVNNLILYKWNTKYTKLKHFYKYY